MTAELTVSPNVDLDLINEPFRPGNDHPKVQRHLECCVTIDSLATRIGFESS